MVANNICDDFLKKLGEIQNMSLAGERQPNLQIVNSFLPFMVFGLPS